MADQEGAPGHGLLFVRPRGPDRAPYPAREWLRDMVRVCILFEALEITIRRRIAAILPPPVAPATTTTPAALPAPIANVQAAGTVQSNGESGTKDQGSDIHTDSKTPEHDIAAAVTANESLDQSPSLTSGATEPEVNSQEVSSTAEAQVQEVSPTAEAHGHEVSLTIPVAQVECLDQDSTVATAVTQAPLVSQEASLTAPAVNAEPLGQEFSVAPDVTGPEPFAQEDSATDRSPIIESHDQHVTTCAAEAESPSQTPSLIDGASITPPATTTANMDTTHHSPNLTPASPSPATPNYIVDTTFDASVAFADLGLARAEHDVAAAGDRDYALQHHGPARPAPLQAGTDASVYGWHIFQHTTNDKDAKADLKEDLHSGQLHRQNRAARDMGAQGIGAQGLGYGNGMGMGMGAGGQVGFGHGYQGAMGHAGDVGGGRGGRGGKTKGKGGHGAQAQVPDLICGVKPPGEPVPPMMKGCPEELDESFFWSEPIV